MRRAGQDRAVHDPSGQFGVNRLATAGGAGVMGIDSARRLRVQADLIKHSNTLAKPCGFRLTLPVTTTSTWPWTVASTTVAPPHARACGRACRWCRGVAGAMWRAWGQHPGPVRPGRPGRLRCFGLRGTDIGAGQRRGPAARPALRHTCTDSRGLVAKPSGSRHGSPPCSNEATGH